MKRGVTILLCCLWLLVVAVIVNLSGGSLIDEVPRFMLLSSSIESGSEFIGLDGNSDVLYGLLALKTNEGENQTYRILALSGDGQTLAATPVFELSLEEEGGISDFACTSEGFYLSVISESKERAWVYFVEAENLSEDNLEGNKEAEGLALEAVQTLSAGNGRQINWAGYEDGAFVSWKDDGTGVEYYSSDAAQDAVSEQLLMDAGQEANNQQFYVICNLVLLFVGFGVIFFSVRALYHKSYTVYITVLTEVLLFVLTFGGAAYLSWTQANTSEEEKEKFGRYYLEIFSDSLDMDSFQSSPESDSFYSEDTYFALWSSLLNFVRDERTEGYFQDLCLVRSADQRILVSASGRNGAVLSDLYDIDENLIQVTFETEEGFSCTLTAVRAGTGGWLSADASVGVYFGTAAVLFLLLSAVCCGLLLRQGREITKLSQAMLAASEGQEVPFGGKVRSRDVSVMWNSFMELQKKISRINYTRYRIYESCYRFAPKDIEKIFGKDSITEVAGGDSVRLKGTVAFVTSDEPESPDEESAARMSAFVTQIERHQEESGGFFVPGNSDLTSLRVLFLEDNHQSVDFGTSLLNEFYALSDRENMRVGVLLHYSELLYAVAGNDNQCFPFLLSQEKEQMESFTAWFRELELKLVITNEVKGREKIVDSSCRYIGYLILAKSGRKLELFEVLIACAPVERRLKLDTEEKFQKAIRLFYQHDFYLARSGFSDVLKVNPLDKMCKWYLFTCEKYLNQAYSAEDICRLRPDAR
ncbi:MAG: hypothetical protein LUC90_07150 [Lachnospiraceae bacterium]|nr:hypothetical protein [Lachnospiraceae bacterium]